MPFKQAGRIRYYQFDILEEKNLFHAVVTRQEGISPAPWDSLNMGGSGGDELDNISENRRLVFEAFSIPNETIFDVWQVHGTRVICTDRPRIVDTPHQKADAILSNTKNITLLMLFADCVPILLYDPIKQVVGIVHAGWKGTVNKIAAKAVEKMVTCFGSQPSNIIAAIGPSIGPDHYIVGNDVILSLRESLGTAADNFLQPSDYSFKFNLWDSNRYILKQMGVNLIEVAGLCTACHLGDWFSHRAENGRTGRFGVLIRLSE